MSGKRCIVPVDTERIVQVQSRNRQKVHGRSEVHLPEINQNHRSSFYQSIQNKNNNIKVYKEEDERRKDLDNIQNVLDAYQMTNGFKGSFGGRNFRATTFDKNAMFQSAKSNRQITDRKRQTSKLPQQTVYN